MPKKVLIVIVIIIAAAGAGAFILGRQAAKNKEPKYRATNIKTGGSSSFPISSTQLSARPVSYLNAQDADVYSFDKTAFALVKINVATGRRQVLMDGLNLEVGNVSWSLDKSKAILSFLNNHATEFAKDTPFNEWGNLLVNLAEKKTTELPYQFRNVKWIDNREIIYKLTSNDGTVLYTASLDNLKNPVIIGSISEEDDYLPAGNKIFIASMSTDASPVAVRVFDRQSSFSQSLGMFDNFSGWQAAGSDFLLIHDGVYKFYLTADLTNVSSLSTGETLAVSRDKIYLLAVSPDVLTLTQYLPLLNQRLKIAEFKGANIGRVSSFLVWNSILVLDTDKGLVKLRF